MSLVENLINQISSPNTGGITKPQGFDLNDDTFAKLLEKASQINGTETQNNMIGQLGVPAGFEIEPLDGTGPISTIQEISPSSEIEIKDLKVSEDFFSSLMNDNSNVMNFAKRQAANAYNLFGKNFVENLNEFVQDTLQS